MGDLAVARKKIKYESSSDIPATRTGKSVMRLS